MNINVGDTFWPVMDEQFGELIVVCAEPGEVLIFAAHAAVSAIFATEVGDFDDGANENALTEPGMCRLGGFVMKYPLRLPPNLQ